MIPGTLKSAPLLENVIDRARRVCSGNTKILKTWLFTIEKSGKGAEVFREAVSSCVNNGKLKTVEDYLEIYLLQCDFFRRLLSANDGSVVFTIISAVKDLRGAFDEAQNFLQVHYPTWLPGWLSLLSYRAAVEDELINTVSQKISEADDNFSNSMNISLPDISPQTQSVWEGFIAQFESNAAPWLGYIKWLRANGEFDLCRKLYRKAVTKVTEGRIEIVTDFVSFERAVGTLDGYADADNRWPHPLPQQPLKCHSFKAKLRPQAPSFVVKSS